MPHAARPERQDVSIEVDEQRFLLPLGNDGRLVGIVTERDFINIASRLLEQKSAGSEAASATASVGK